MAQLDYEDLNVNDKRMVDALRKMLDQVDNTRRGMFHETRIVGCVCLGTALCAHHAQVYNRLVTVADELAKAIKDASREG